MTPWRAPHINVVAAGCTGPLRVLLCGFLALAAGGCAERNLETYYGRRQLPLSSASVNGTDVLAALFAEAGHTVAVRRALFTSDMEAVDTIVWFPDDVAAPSEDVCLWFDQWLAGESGRTLIYVGRGFDAAAMYYRKMAPLVSPELRDEYRKREREAVATALPRPLPKGNALECEWFKTLTESPSEPRELSGPWSEGIAAGKTEIELSWRPELVDAETPLLAWGDDAIVQRQRGPWEKSQLIMVANGSFLLNLPLVNHEHRKLAGKLIDAVGRPGRVVFLESDHGGPPVDPPATDSSLWRVFGAWPLNAILLHFAVLGVIFCFARWPIFGRPKTPPSESITDFGKHVEAVGELLRRTKDRNYALTKLPPAEDATGAADRGSQPKSGDS